MPLAGASRALLDRRDCHAFPWPSRSAAAYADVVWQGHRRRSSVLVVEVHVKRLRKSAVSRPQLPGLISFSLSRVLRDRAVVLVSVSHWTDIDTMAAALGPGWQEPS